nr:PEP/pyruvate-binding domain-containing protein [Pseudactinotalea sp. HY160]
MAGSSTPERHPGSAEEPDAADVVSRLGAKAAGLARLVAAGIAVPEGLVLSTEAHRDALALAALHPPVDEAARRPLPVPPAVGAAVHAIAAHFAGATLAVRSSAVVEDGPLASHAGLYRTVLGVRGEDRLRAAVRACWESAASTRVGADTPGPAGAGGMAVLVQRQLDPDVAGVAFSADPVTGDRDVAVVSAVPGLGDRLAAGLVTPDRWRVTGGAALAERASLQALTAEQARAIADLAARIEAIIGAPADVEWAMDAGRLVVLQARPITALPRPPRPAHLPGTWTKETERYAEPMTALGASLATRAVADGLSAAFRRYGGLIGRVECRSIGGELYQRMVPLAGDGTGAPPHPLLLTVLARTALRRRMRAARVHASPTAVAAAVARWREIDRPDLEHRLETLRAVATGGLDGPGLAAHLRDSRDLFARAMRLHFDLTVPGIVPVYAFVRVCRRLLGYDDRACLRLLAGASPATSAGSLALARIGERLAEHPGARARVAAGEEVAAVLAETSPDLARDYADWLHRYARSCLNDDPGSGVLADRPDLVRALLLTDPAAASGRVESVRSARRRAVAQARSGLAVRARRKFDAALAAAEAAHGLREEVAFWTGSQCGGLVHEAALAAGRGLARQGRIDRAHDVVDLGLDDLLAAVEGGGADLRAAVATARAERAWTRAHPGPAVLGGPSPGPPDLRGLPRRARLVNEAMLWARAGRPAGPGSDPPTRPAHRPAHGPTRPAPRNGAVPILTGIPGSPGRYRGAVRIVDGEADAGTLRGGEVLVTRMTDPAWSALFPLAGALVTDIGGELSHAAIVAREYGIPAVLGTVAATSTLRDGEPVEVDGTAGMVFGRGGDAATPPWKESS